MALYHAKLDGTTSEIEQANLGDVRTWLALTAPSAVEKVDWDKVEKGAPYKLELSSELTLRIKSDIPQTKTPIKTADGDIKE